MSDPVSIQFTSEDGRDTLRLEGSWTVAFAEAAGLAVEGAVEKLRAVKNPTNAALHIDAASIHALDTAGAWLICRLRTTLQQQGVSVSLTGLDPKHAPLLALVETPIDPAEEAPAAGSNFLGLFLQRIGAGVFFAGRKALALTNFVGMVAVALLGAFKNPRRLRPISLVNQIELTGFRALPIIGLLSFLIGVVLAYLMSDQLRQFGADLFTVDLIGLSIVREVGVLITAIMIAGRSGSAFTAEIGTMKVNEELDAMRTLGLDPVEVLVLPRVIALIITLPFLVFFANCMGILGGAVMTILALDLTPLQFIQQLKAAITVEDFVVGMAKAPVHAFIIAVVGCYEGFRVERSAESVGKQTTMAVVESIFLVILATAGFAILFSFLGI